MPESSAPDIRSKVLLSGIAKPEGSAPRVRGYVTCRALGSMKSARARREALDRAGFASSPVYCLKQLHGTVVHRVVSGTPPEPIPEGDGWVTDVAGPVLAVYVADCLPLFLWERSGKAAGVFHAGWRGLAQGMPRRAVEAFRTHFGIAPESLDWFIGPHIGPCCYHVGPETAERFPASSRIERDGKLFLDLAGDAVRQLREAGVTARGAGRGGCTSCEHEQFFSFRREKSDSRMLAFISLAEAASA